MLHVRHRPEPRAWLPLALVACAVFWVAARQHVLTIDSYYYLWDVEFASWQRLWHPHHLLLEPLLRGLWNLWRELGWPHRAVLPLQLLGVVTMLGALALAARLLRALLGRNLLVVCWWLLLAVSYQTWYFATQTEGVPQFALLGTAYLVWAAELPQRGAGSPPDARTALALAATIALAVLVHQALVLAAPLLAAMLAREAPPGRRLRLLALSLGGAGAAVAAVYATVGAWVTGGLHPGELWSWLTGYRQEFAHCCGSWHLVFSRDVPRGLGAAFFTGDPLGPYVFGGRPLDGGFVARLLPPVLVAAALTAGLLRLPLAWRDSDRPRRRALVNVALVVLVGALFAGWWEPSNRKFWSPVLPGLVALAALGSCAWLGRLRRMGPALLAALAAMTLAYNLAGAILPRHRAHDAHQPLLQFLRRHTGPDDAVVLPEDRTWQTAIYWLPDRTIHGLPGPHSDRNDPARTVLRAAARDAVAALRDGCMVYVADGAWAELRAALPEALRARPLCRPVLRFGDADLDLRDQVLLAVHLPPALVSAARLPASRTVAPRTVAPWPAASRPADPSP